MLLRIGSTGAAVGQLQAFLNVLPTKLKPLKLDAIFGPRTQGRVHEFQGANGLAVDGVVGDLTWAALVAILTALGRLLPNVVPQGLVRPINDQILGMNGPDNLIEQILPARMLIDPASFRRGVPSQVLRFGGFPMQAVRLGLFAAGQGGVERCVMLVLPKSGAPKRLMIAVTQTFAQANEKGDLDKLGWSDPLSKPFIEFALLKHVVNRYAPQVIASKREMGFVYILRAKGSAELGPFQKGSPFWAQVLGEMAALTGGAFAFDEVEMFTYSSGINEFNTLLGQLKGVLNVVGVHNIDPANALQIARPDKGFATQFLSGQTGGPRPGFEFLPHPSWKNEPLFRQNEPKLFDYLHNKVMPGYCLHLGIQLT